MALLPDGNILIAGGTSTAKVVGSIVLFNLTDQTFTPIGTLLTPRTNAASSCHTGWPRSYCGRHRHQRCSTGLY